MHEMRRASYRVVHGQYHPCLMPMIAGLKGFIVALHPLPCAGEWVVIDERRLVYFSKHQQTMEFDVKEAVASSQWMFEFTAVSAGCASKSLQVSLSLSIS